MKVRDLLIWVALAVTLIAPIAVAAGSPLLAWRQPVYIVASFAGIVGLAFLFIQPLLAGGFLPGVSVAHGRRLHGWVGLTLVTAVAIHVGGLWITSPPDVVDALLFRSPTPFSIWGVIAMWAVFASALLALLRQTKRIRVRFWRLAHMTLALIIVVGTVVHAVLIEGTMGTITKAALCCIVIAVNLKALLHLKAWSFLTNRPG